VLIVSKMTSTRSRDSARTRGVVAVARGLCLTPSP
jgi:hypothetical protein